GGQGEQQLLQGVHRLLGDKAGAAGGHHHRVHHDVFGLVLLQLARNHLNEAGGGDHSGLDRVGEDVGENAVQLIGQKFRGGLEDAVDAGGVLGRQGGDRAHGVDAVGGHGLDVGLDSGASAGVASSDRQCCFHGKTPF